MAGTTRGLRGSDTERKAPPPIRRLLALGCVAVTFGAAGGSARISVENAPIHHALWAPHADTSLLAATITGLEGLERLAPGLVFVDRIAVRVHGVILDRDWNDGPDAVLSSTHLRWPEVLVPPEEEARILVLLRNDWPEPGHHLVEAVLPRSRRVLQAVRTEAAAQRVVEEELLAALDSSGPAERLEALLRTLGPILSPANLPHLEPSLDHPARSVRRAALGARMQARPDDPTARGISRDLSHFFSEGPGRDCFDGGGGCPALTELLKSYPFLDPRSRRWGSRWDEASAAAAEARVALLRPHLALPADALEALDPAP